MLAGCGGAAGTSSSDGSAAGSTTTTHTTSSTGAGGLGDTSADRCSALTSFAAVPATCAALGDSFDQALAALGTTRCGLGFAPVDLALSMFDPTRQQGSADYLALHARPTALPGYGAGWKASLATAASASTPLAHTLGLAATRRGDAIDACTAAWAPDAGDPAPLVSVLVELGAAPTDAQTAATVPLDVQQALAPVLRAAGQAASAVYAVRPSDGAAREQLAGIATWIVGVRHFDLTADFEAQIRAVDVARIESAAVRLSAVIESAHLVAFAGRDVPPVTVVTPLGTFILRGAGADTYGAEADHALLAVDTGGNDVYQAAVAASSVASPVSVSLDLGGDDRYGYAALPVAADAVGARQPSDGEGRAVDGRSLSTTFRQGVGALGIGLLFDLGVGDDAYASLVGSQGVGALGVGALYDDGGADSYVAEGFAQGAGAFGVGVLLDASGDDHAVLYTAGQGFGFAGGVGLLVDVAGDDSYLANPGDASLSGVGGDTLYGSDQLPGLPTSAVAGNMSFAQGCGEGHRPDWPDADHPFPGGTGVLADLAGSDRYRADVWGQGIGFVAGVGLLLDGAGNDTYDALYYAQGAGAHMGIGLLADDAGDDVYDGAYPAVDAMLGMGEDFSVGIHLDGGGDDHYTVDTCSMGEGNGNSVAFAVNVGGSDAFGDRTGSLTYGAAAPASDISRQNVPSYGVFLKVDGPSWYRDHASGEAWSSVTGAAGLILPPLRAYGADLPGGSVTFPAP